MSIPPKAQMSIRIRSAMVWSGADGFNERDLSVANGRIVSNANATTHEISGAGLWLIPGLIDAHFHAYSTGLDPLEEELGPLSYTAINATERLSRALYRGFTTVRDVAGGDIGIAMAIEQRKFDSPRYYYTGPALSQTGGHGDPRVAHVDTEFVCGHLCEVVDGVDDLRRAVRHRFRTGAHAIKVMASGGVTSLMDPLRPAQYSEEELRAVVEEAARRESYVCAHAYSDEAIRHALRDGVRSIEHGNLMTAETASLMARTGAFLVPTLATYAAMSQHGSGAGLPSSTMGKNAEVLHAGQRSVQLALAAEVNVGFGSDLMGDLERHQLLGLRMQCAASDVTATIRAATSMNASLLQEPLLGTLAEGAHADLLGLRRNPLEYPNELWSSEPRALIIQEGRVIRGLELITAS